MKKRWKYGVTAALAISAFVALPFGVRAEGEEISIEDNFEDANFKTFVSENYDKNGNGSLSQAELDAVEEMDVSDMGIQSLKGVEYFTNLKKLWCGYNDIVELDLTSNAKLEELGCGCQGSEWAEEPTFKSLDVSGLTSLKTLYCGRSRFDGPGTLWVGLSKLDASGCTALEKLLCGNDHYAYTDVHMELNLDDCRSLKVLTCYGTGLEALDLSDCGELELLDCYYNDLTALDLSHNTKLSILDCGGNDFEALDLSANHELKELYCDGGSVKSLDLSGNENLEQCRCTSPKLTSLNVSNNKKLEELRCYETKLTKLDISKCDGLKLLNCSICDNLSELVLGGNKSIEKLSCELCPALKSLDLSGCSNLKEIYCGYYSEDKSQNLEEINLSGCSSLKYLNCPNNKLAAIDISDCKALIYVDCKNNRIKEIDLSNNQKLEGLSCYGNQIKKLNIANCSILLHLYNDKTRQEEKGEDEKTEYYYWYDSGRDPDYTYILSISPDTTIETKPPVKPGWTEKDGKKMYIGADGNPVKGLQTIDGKKYYFGTDGTMKTGWQKVGNKWYFFSKTAKTLGQMQTGWLQDGKNWYFMSKNTKTLGQMQTGWLQDGKKWYFLSKDTKTLGQMQTGWLQDGKKWYFLKKDGTMAANEYCQGYWLNQDGTWTYKRKASWKKDKTGWWFGDGKWYAKNCTLTIDGKKYSFNSKGYLK